MTRDYFRQIRIGSGPCGHLDPIFEWECRICNKRFPFEDRNGRNNEIGRNAHLSKHVKERMQAKEK